MGIPFDQEFMTEENLPVPEYCPVLRIRLQENYGKRQDSSPSIDRVIPERGYVRGNVAVISWRANKLKSDGSSDEHRKIADWINGRKP